MKKRALIAPSILSADFSKIGEEIREVESAGCDLIHVDVMDGHFVPNITIGPTVIRSIRKVTKLPLDVHLMIEDPIRYIKEFRDAGSDWITVHVEACQDVSLTLKQIKKLGAKVGISLRPKTGIGAIRPFLAEVDLVLVMTVEPGFGGQKFMPQMVQKIKELRPVFEGLISVDGGIAPDTARVTREAGVDIFVAGSAIFNAKDRKKSIGDLRQAFM
ncbi:MAG: ribulose-phosphate 3-epimerase [Candidatus Omnitrophica bacterium]|nr:ribulose-phosphate 3-epimerase [Candidatus Omnitrophota bacterium]